MRPIRDVLADCDRIREPEQWCSPEKVETLVSLVYATRPKTVVEIGLWRGGSFLPLALAMHGIADGVALGRKVIGIDPYDSADSVKGQTGENATWWGGIDHQGAFERLKKMLVELELTHVVFEVPNAITGPTCTLVEIWHCSSTSRDNRVIDTIDLLHIDGNHGPQAEADAAIYASRVPVGGIVVLDDCGWTGGHVAAAAAWLEADGFIALYDLPPGRVYQRARFR